MIYRLSTTPPSVNSIYENNRPGANKARRRSAGYNEWIAKSIPELSPVVPITSEKYELHIHLPKNMRGDLDNRAKATIDLLVSVGATPDDKHLEKLTMTKSTESGTIIEVIGL